MDRTLSSVPGIGWPGYKRWFSGPLAMGILIGLVIAGCAPSGEEGVAAEEASGEGASVAGGAAAVWLDVDPAMGLPQSEVDDGLAMLQAFASPELAIRGISVVFGNTALANGVPVAESLVADFGPEGLSVASGAASSEELGQSNEAVEALAAALRREPLTVFALGPVTNVASLVQLHPDVLGNIERIVMVAARRVGQSFRTGAPSNTPHRDFNFELDAPAMQVLLDTEIELVFAPWEVSSKVWLRQADLDALAETGERGTFVASQVETWVQRWQDNLGVDGFNPFDTLAIGWLTHPEQIETIVADAWIESAEDDVEPGQTKPYLYVEPVVAGSPDPPEGRRRVVYATAPTEDFKPTLLRRLAGTP